ncbi:hypothetical protein HanXRQr2_Chr12g0527571 [Helianthus annuus]|uniref:Uncharacterized protein n=1 Tax=Helianthus annuus TaxID=4232 RepID=A0A251SZ96_HELAN|nr:hypothetical protein HanXRQr2_Chr12g0527571 [Helianthus annuus]KAJ0478963.1 hypothetical protein HanHA300_Chr13g0505641 [Helianthus annuus]KAJ0491891.1 hypothetical protein HanIR_Chr12g0568801 [Helianthus annuus]KAJ0499759.1 hypothetical protein HanHA89_Chr13g0537501 [Helianthus annuus]KAJ0665836.1 hypothetical protein HanLR1_Chr13g0508111 [Helianthus annuus]
MSSPISLISANFCQTHIQLRTSSSQIYTKHPTRSLSLSISLPATTSADCRPVSQFRSPVKTD